MPTGYTAGVRSGSIATFKDFALVCARQFGALIHMRDEDGGAEIRPQTVSPYHENSMRDAANEITRLSSLSVADRQREADEATTSASASRRQSFVEAEAGQRRYRLMLAHVEAWEPPTPEHENMKRFMIDQLKQSIEWDALPRPEEFVRKNGEAWYWERVSELSRSIEYHKTELEKERARVDAANEWVEALKDSLG